MTDARSRTPQEHIRRTVRRWGRGRILLVGVLGALVMVAVGVISAAALVGLSPLSTSNTPANSSTASNTPSNTNGGASQAGSPVNDVPAVAPEVATVSAAATPISYVCANKESGLLFYLATCKKSQTKVSVAPDVEKQFKACYWALCNGQLMTINQNQALFSLLGTDVSAASRITSRGNRP